MGIPVYSSTIMRKEMDAVLSCMVSERTGPGEISRRLSEAAKEAFSMAAAFPLRSCAVALRYALDALRLEPGSKVVISALSPAWHYKCARQLGFVPVIAETDPETAQLTAEAVKDAARRGGRALLLFDALGFLPDLPGILEAGIPVIEDISQSAGAFYGADCSAEEDEGSPLEMGLPPESAPGGGNGEDATGLLPAQAFCAGSSAAFSILGLEERDLLTAGGGAILLAPASNEAAILRGMLEDAPETDILSDMNSSLALVQLREMKKNRAVRSSIYKVFMQALLHSRSARHRPLRQRGGGEPSYYSFPVIVDSAANDVRRYASREGISTGLAFGDSVAALLGDSLEGFIHAKSLLMRCLLFPLYPRLGAKNIEKIAKVLRSLP